MTGPATSGKNKRNVKVTSEILRKIHATGEITDEDVNQLYMILKPICKGCRVNNKDNPNCFCGLIPPTNGSRKYGLWQRMSDIVYALGRNPCKDLRQADSPAGLTNLGATCYANSILQLLYMNKSFREGVFSVEPDVLNQQPVLDQLAQLFALLHSSRVAFVDSAPFINTLELDSRVQQDSHEFLTLLLSLLKGCLKHSKVPKARTIVQDLFQGNVSHVTKCLKCGKDSEASSNTEAFYDLELNVKDFNTLEESLDNYLSAEILHGDNQYFCELCKTGVEAIRSSKLWRLPDVLNIQLKRYAFLTQTSTTKITSAFCFPGELNMRSRLSEPCQVDLIYDLSAVLVHKGTAVNSGHYIAHIKDENTGQWWEFNDEHVSKLGHHPFGEGFSADKIVHYELACPAAAERMDAVTDRNHMHGSHGQRFSSSDAYMLMYKHRHTSKNDEGRPVLHATNHVAIEGNQMFSNDGFPLPAHLFEHVKGLNDSYIDACKKYEVKKENEINQVVERRQEVQSILSEAPVHSAEEPFYWISLDWLRMWAGSTTPFVLDNTCIQCSHGKVPVSKVGSIKRLSAEAWTKLVSKCGGGPALSHADYCTACLIDSAKSLVSADGYRNRRTLMRNLARNVLSGNCQDGTHYVSKTWLQQWMRKSVDAPTEADAGPTISIRCPHGQLMPEQALGAKRLLVPESLWLFFYEDALTVKPDDSFNCTSFPSNSEQCPQCGNELSEVACLEDSLRAAKLKQRQSHKKLAMGKSVPVSLNCKYYLVPSCWLTKWRNYVNASGTNISSSMEPDALDFVIDSLKCKKHSRLLERPPDLVCKRGILCQKVPMTDQLTIITEDDWNSFCEEWGGDKEKGISAIIESSNVVENIMPGSCGEMPMGEEHPSPQVQVNDGNERRQPVVRTFPEICKECIGERESCELMQKLGYINEEIIVTLVHDKEAPRSILKASEAISDQDRRVSKRLRKTSSENSVNLKVSGSTSIYQLKMMIWGSLGVVKENQILRKGSRIIDQERASLADFNIFPGDNLWVQDSGIHEYRDIAADELADQEMDAQGAGEGFRGTRLTGNVTSKVVEDV